MRIVKGFNPEPSRGRGSPGLTAQEKRAREAAIEKELAAYIHLKCGHYTTKEADLLVSTWRPKGNPYKYFCETCGAWREKFKPVARLPLPNEPLF